MTLSVLKKEKGEERQLISENTALIKKRKGILCNRKVFGQLVALGFDVAVFTPAPYQRSRLERP